MFESWPEMWGGGYPAYRTTLRKFLWFRTVTGGNAPEFKTVTGRIVNFLTKRIAPLKIEATLEPIQDLHGYENPWPGGGGANQWDEEWESGQLNATSGGNQSNDNCIRSKNYIPIQPSTSYYIVASTYNLRLHYYDADKTFISPRVDNASGVITTPNNAYYARFFVGGSTQPVTTYANDIAINYPSSVTTYSPYSNICPISGHSGAKAFVRNNNLFDGEVEAGAYDLTTGEKIAGSGTPFRCKNFIPVQSGMVIKIASNVYRTWMRALFYDKSQNFLSYTSPTIPSAGSVTITVPDNCHYLTFCTASTTQANAESLRFMYPSTVTECPDYDGSSVTITFGSTVYGCELTVNEDGSGTAVSEQACVTVTECAAVRTASTGIPYAAINLTPTAIEEAASNNFISSGYKFRVNAPSDTGWFRIASGVNLYIFDTRFTDKTTADSILASEQPQFCYTLATPITIPLTPGQVNALLGNNTVWVDDSDSISVTYQSN